MKYLFNEALINALDKKGYAIIDAALPAAMAAALLQTAVTQLAEHSQAAGMGRQRGHAINQGIRSDRICWLNASEPASVDYLQAMEQIRLMLNAALLLGLYSYEAHYACYPAGAYYRKHVDAFTGRRNRLLSTVCYLNRNWPATAGGELVMYAEDGMTTVERVQPLFNRMVVFLSEQFPHEVLPATQSRYSIAGWFKGLP